MVLCRIVDHCLDETLSFSSWSEFSIRFYSKISGLHKVVSTNCGDDGVIEFIIEDYGS